MFYSGPSSRSVTVTAGALTGVTQVSALLLSTSLYLTCAFCASFLTSCFTPPPLYQCISVENSPAVSAINRCGAGVVQVW